MYYIIITTEYGLRIADVREGEDADNVARGHCGIVIDYGPFLDRDTAEASLFAINEEYAASQAAERCKKSAY